MGAENWSRLSLAKRVIDFCVGMVIGFSVACLILNSNCSSVNLNLSEFFKRLRSPAIDVEKEINVYSHEAFRNSTETGTTLPISSQSPDDSNHAGEDVEGTTLLTRPPSTTEGAHVGEDIEAQRLAKQVRVLCWVMTGPSNHERKAIHVKNTWGKRCNKLIFMSSESDEKLGAVGLPNVQEGRDWLWAKTKAAFKYVWEHHRDEADWFMKADDDTYVVVENLRYMLSQFDPAKPVHFGCRFKFRPHLPELYMSGGCGYALSREALRRFVEQSLPNKTKCQQSHSGEEDVEMSRCLHAVGVEIGDSRDTFGRDRFFQFPPERYVMNGGFEGDWSWYWQKVKYPHKEGMDCCSDTTISFHYITPNQMYFMEFLIYHLRHFYSVPVKDLSNATEHMGSMTTTSDRSTAIAPPGEDVMIDSSETDSYPSW